jgi:putative transposase
MSLYQNKYRIESARLKNWDYGSAAAYFITICTQNRISFFGKIQNGEMLLNDIGIIVQTEWLKTPPLRPDMNLLLDEFVVMPNHFHAIIFIGENEFNYGDTKTANKFGPQSKNLGSIMRGFKSSVTTQAHKINPDFDWQQRYHDHIIRNHESFCRIQHYIINNPANWKDDNFFIS